MDSYDSDNCPCDEDWAVIYMTNTIAIFHNLFDCLLQYLNTFLHIYKIKTNKKKKNKNKKQIKKNKIKPITLKKTYYFLQGLLVS
jgi:hypothetical protein